MRRMSICCLSLATLCLCLCSIARSQGADKPGGQAPSASAAAPTSGARAEFLAEVAFYEQRYIRLAQAVPAEKYTWRPAEGVRSIGEVYNHIVAANYGIARTLGTQLPAGFDSKAIMANSGDKAKTIQALKDSFAHFRQAVIAVGDADLDKPLKLFGQQTTYRGAFIMITGHTGEHLGQSIAYARMNGIVPPWTEDQQQQQQQKPPAKP
jgi:uncharacterized damage-inducible protein DinB